MAEIKTLSSETAIVNGKAVITEQLQTEMTPAEVDRQIQSIEMQKQQVLGQVENLRKQYNSLEAQKVKYEEIKAQFPAESEGTLFNMEG